MLEVLQVLARKSVPAVECEDVATYVRLVNENVQERFAHELMKRKRRAQTTGGGGETLNKEEEGKGMEIGQVSMQASSRLFPQ